MHTDDPAAHALTLPPQSALAPLRPRLGLLRWALLGLIRLYRARLSGRGPLRAVRCRFAHAESCSAYGLRVAACAPSAFAALRLIRGRLRRCGAACVWRWLARDGSPHIGWHPDLDATDADAFDASWAAALELPPARALGLRCLAFAASLRHDAPLSARALHLSQSLTARQAPDPATPPPPLAAWGVAASLRARSARASLTALCLCLLTWTLWGLAPALLLSGASWAWATRARLTIRQRMRRRERASLFALRGA